MTDTTEHGDYAVLVALGSELATLFDRLARRYANLTLVQYQALSALRAHSPEPLEPWELGRILRTGSNHVTMILDQLVRAGLVERHPHGQDRRRRLVSLTEEGTMRAATLEPYVRDLEERLLSSALSEPERAELGRLAARLRQTMAEVVVPARRVRPGP